jgi:tetratricopeptide (TPR) repeat protein
VKAIYTILLLSGLYFSASAQQVDNALLLDYYQSQKFADAAKYLKSIYPEPVTDIKALTNLAYTSRMSGSLADAEGYYQRIYDKDSSNVAILFSLGNINVSRGNSLKAIGYYQKILARDSTNFNVYKELANLVQSQSDTVTYGKYLVKANTMNPQEPDVAYDLGRLYIALKKYDKAANVLDKAIQADSANLTLMTGKAEVCFRQKKFPETITTCLKLMQSGEKSAYVYQWLAISYFQMREYKLCLAALLAAPPQMQNESTYYYEAMCYKSLDDQPNAINALKSALKDGISFNVPNYYNELGDSYSRLHQIKKATTAYQKSLFFDETPMVYYSLANLYDTEIKDKKSPLKYYKKYLASKPPVDEKKYIDYATIRIPALGGK